MKALPAETPYPSSAEAVRALSASLGEPVALSDARLAAFGRFDAARVQDSRYTRVPPDWQVQEWVAPAPARAPDLPAEGCDPAPPQKRDLAAHLMGHPEALHGLFGLQASPWDGLSLAFGRSGEAFVWRAGERSAKPAWLTRAAGPGLSSAPVWLEVGEGAEASALLVLGPGDVKGLCLTPIRGVVREGGSLKLLILSEGGESKHHLSLDLEVRRDARVELFGAWLGGKWSVARLRGRLAEPGATWTETHVAAADRRDHHDWDTKVVHAAPHTTCDIQAKTALAGRARAVLTGNIRMEQISSGSSANLTDHVLMLSPGARADSLPGLEIEALDVKASHAASVGQPDEAHLLYLMSRGMDPAQARRLVVSGFLAAALQRNPLPAFGEALAGRIEAFFGGTP